jgi:hypothetical protein
VTGSHERKPLGSIKSREFFDQLSAVSFSKRILLHDINFLLKKFVAHVFENAQNNTQDLRFSQ